MTIQQSIKKAMDAQGVNTPELARRCGLNPQTLYNYFSGRNPRGLTTETLEKIMAALGLKLA